MSEPTADHRPRDPQRPTRLTPEGYLRCWDDDLAALLATTTADPATVVPSCPGWTLADLWTHVGEVYAHKAAAIRDGAPPDPWPPARGEGFDPVAWLRESAADLRGLLAGADPSAPAWSWWPPEQTLGFWQRRMAQETAVHRWDAELALGAPAPIEPALAVDGCDELLGWLTWAWDDLPQPEANGQLVVVRTDGAGWRVRLEPTVVGVALDDDDADELGVDAVVAGPPSDLLLHLWGRLPGAVADGRVSEDGDPLARQLLRARLAMATD